VAGIAALAIADRGDGLAAVSAPEGAMNARPRPSLVIGVVALTLMLGLSASCGGGAGSAGSSASKPGGPATVSPSAQVVPSGPQVSCDARGWGTAPVSVRHRVAVPPVPVLTAIRAAGHSDCGYDRLVLDLSGALPGYTIRYVDQVIAGASGQAVALPGSRHLLITMRPSQAHQASGEPTVSGRIVTLGLPMLTAYTVAGDFEGVVTVAVGVRSMTAIRVGELPGRLYIDFRR
jgi:hypothetical protein